MPMDDGFRWLRQWMMACVHFVLQPRTQGFMRKRSVLERRKADVNNMAT
jgi:hypothetical protein